MTLLEQLRKENMEALKNHDSEKKGVCTLLMSALILAEKEKKAPLEKGEELAIVQKELKQTKETLSLTPADRPELIEATKRKIAMLESYLPKQLGEEEIRAAISQVIADKALEPVRKNQGAIMKELLAAHKGQLDGKEAARILGSILH